MKQPLQRFQGWWFSLPIRRRGLVIIAIPVTCFLATLMAVGWLKASLVEDEAWVQHTQTVRLETKRLLNALVDAETGIRGYGLTQDAVFLEPYEEAQVMIPRCLERLQGLVQDNPQQTQQIGVIREKVAENLALFATMLTQYQQGNISERQEVQRVEQLMESKANMDEARREIERFATTEESLLEVRKAHQAFYRQLTWLVFCISAMVSVLGAIVAVYLFARLERELAMREGNLRFTNQRLQAACEQLERFSANASHELRTPLAAVLSNAQVGLMDLEEGEEALGAVRQRLQKIVALTKQMSDLVGQLLFLARQDGGVSLEGWHWVDLTRLIQDLESEWLTETKKYGIKFSCHYPFERVRVQGDSNLLRHAIANLLSNACHYTPSGGKIGLKLQLMGDPRSERLHQRAMITVRDTGVGIPREALPHIFERFYRVDGKRSKGAGKFGLGLAIAEQIVRVHGGTITAQSTLGEGSVFQITLSPVNDNSDPRAFGGQS
ncbi:MAG: histidine kinase [Kamptonema sp. SIO4C4]|nr:histidine kinase [Kamptonema sp. SIO4C4]